MFKILKCFVNNTDKNLFVGNRIISFGWQMECSKNNVFQKTYEINIYNSNKELIKTTGKVEDNSNKNIYIQIEQLESNAEYYWDVTVSNNYDEIAKSSVNKFETTLLDKSDWKAKWIEANILNISKKEEFDFRKIFSYNPDNSDVKSLELDTPVTFEKSFAIKENKVKKARLFVTSLGIYEASLNGKKIGNEYFAPGFTTYSKLLFFQTHDITNILKSDNLLEITVADGWYKGRVGLAGIGHQFGEKTALLSQIEIEYENGNKEFIVTDNNFKASTGEIVYSDLFIGEKQDKNREKTIVEVIEKDFGYDNLLPDMAEPIICKDKIEAVRILEAPNGDKIVDFGKNISGIVEVRATGNKGDIINLHHTEELDKDGNFYFNLMGQNKYQTTIFTLKGQGEEVFIPKFTYQGFRYVKVKSYPGELKKENFTAYVLSSDCEKTGFIETSNEKLNQLIKNIYNSQESNFISVPTDCPQREKAGWTGDAQIYIPTAIFNSKVDNFMRRWLLNMRIEQFENGQIPAVIPFPESDKILSSGFGNVSTAGWADACIIIPWNLYKHYDDTSILKENYDMMKNWLNYVENRCKSNVTEEHEDYFNYLWDMDFHYGDWMIPSLRNEDGTLNPMMSAKLTGNQVATIYFAHSCHLLSKIADILCDYSTRDHYQELSLKIKEAFIKKYVNENGIIEKDFQGLYALALQFDIGTEDLNRKFIERLEAKIIENNTTVDTGFLSTPILLDVLSNYGKKELADKLLLSEECPSWLYMVKQGATSIWESWEAIKPDGKRSITSYNHYSLGSVQDYIVRELIGFEKVLDEKNTYSFEPKFNEIIGNGKISYNSLNGNIYFEWVKDTDNKIINMEIPVGITVKFNFESKSEILGSGKYSFSF